MIEGEVGRVEIPHRWLAVLLVGLTMTAACSLGINGGRADVSVIELGDLEVLLPPIDGTSWSWGPSEDRPPSGLLRSTVATDPTGPIPSVAVTRTRLLDGIDDQGQLDLDDADARRRVLLAWPRRPPEPLVGCGTASLATAARTRQFPHYSAAIAVPESSGEPGIVDVRVILDDADDQTAADLIVNILTNARVTDGEPVAPCAASDLRTALLAAFDA